MKNTLFFLTVILFFACKSEEPKIPDVVPVDNSKELEIKVVLKTNVEDVFKIMVNNIEVDELQKKNIVVRETLPVTSNFERINSSFGKDNISNNVAIYLGKKVKKVNFNLIEISYGNNILTINQDNFNEFLRVNKFIEFDQGNFKFTTKAENAVSNPIISLKPNAIKYLKSTK